MGLGDFFKKIFGGEDNTDNIKEDTEVKNFETIVQVEEKEEEVSTDENFSKIEETNDITEYENIICEAEEEIDKSEEAEVVSPILLGENTEEEEVDNTEEEGLEDKEN